jgi:hypothetical protein
VAVIRKGLVLVLGGLLVSAALAQAAATPLTPAPGALVARQPPLFTWAVPPDEEPVAIFVATRPETDASGGFPDDNIRFQGAIGPDTRVWGPERGAGPAWAGDYWWSVLTKRRGASIADIYSPPSPFTIPAMIRIARGLPFPVFRTFVPPSLEIRANWDSNVRRTTMTAKVFHRGRLLWSRRATRASYDEIHRGATFKWPKPQRIARGAVLRITLTVRARSAVASASRLVRAP